MAIFLLAMMFSLFGCASQITCAPLEYSGGEAYKAFTIPEGKSLRFSFEYPSYFNLTYGDFMPEGMYILLRSASFYGGRIKDIDIFVDRPDEAYQNTEALLDERISRLKDGACNDFNIKEKRKIINPDGLEGWEIIISFTEQPISTPVDAIPRAPASVVDREVFFNNDSILWQISLYTDVDSYEQTKVDFEHILRTFKFLE